MSETRSLVRDGLVVGVIGYASVAALYGGIDLAAGRGVLHSVDMLGKAVFRGLRDPAVLSLPQPVDPAAILLYNGLHLLASLLIGLIVTGLVGHVEREPRTAPAVLLTVVGGFAVTIAAIGLATTAMRPVLPWWSIVVANSLATVVAGAYLLAKRPGAWERLIRWEG